jgi:hypothetical protein
MKKLHTHYDNLKVARSAPPEVIRAAYKTLSQKYHPDKNPGDSRAARVMALVNSAYNTLSDQRQRKEHDEWIAATEREMDWLKIAQANQDWAAQETAKKAPIQAAATGLARIGRASRWWLAILVGIAIGWLLAQATPLNPALARMPQVTVLPSSSKAEGMMLTGSSAAVTETGPGKTQDYLLAVISQVTPVPANGACQQTAAQRLVVAPNGEPWPLLSGYVPGYKVANQGGSTRVLVDNSANSSDVFVKLSDVAQNQDVRHVLVLAGQKFTIDNLMASHYEVHSVDLTPLSAIPGCKEFTELDGQNR